MGLHEYGGDVPLPGDTQIIDLYKEELTIETHFRAWIEGVIVRMRPSTCTK